jgi:hypothetical protein
MTTKPWNRSSSSAVSLTALDRGGDDVVGAVLAAGSTVTLTSSAASAPVAAARADLDERGLRVTVDGGPPGQTRHGPPEPGLAGIFVEVAMIKEHVVDPDHMPHRTVYNIRHRWSPQLFSGVNGIAGASSDDAVKRLIERLHSRELLA